MKKIAFLIWLVLSGHVTFSQPCLPEGIEFWSQEQIDSFSVDYPGCTQIEGSVVIGGGNEITNLSGLINLTSIGGRLKISNSYALVDLTGLSGLQSIGSDLIITNNTVLTSLSGFENLESIGGWLEIRYNPILSDITGLQNLDAASVSDLSILDNPSLTNCSAQAICDYLSGPNGIVTIYNNSDGCNNPPDIAKSCGMQMPCLPFGSYYFTTQAEIDSFSVDYPGCNQLNSFVNISGNNIIDLSGLSGITCINGTFSVSDNLALDDLEGLDNLDSITDDFYISYNDSLISLAGLENLSCIGGSLTICFNTTLSSLDGLEGLDSIAGNIWIHNNEDLAGVDGLNNVSIIESHLLIENNPALENLDGLENLNSVGLRLLIAGNDSLNNITGLSSLDYLGDELWIGNNDILQDLIGLESLESIGKNLVIKNNHSLINLSGLNSLSSIGGYLEIGSNEVLENLDALKNLSFINGGLMIYYNDSLTSLSGIDNIHAGTITGLLINHNKYLTACEVKSVCDYLAIPNGTVEIEDNKVGCNSEQEVMEACAVGVDQLDSWTVGQLDISVFPNPARGIVDFRVSSFDSQLARVMLKIYDVQGRERLTVLDEMKSPGEYMLQFDASSLEPGVYFYWLTAEELTTGGKLIVLK